MSNQRAVGGESRLVESRGSGTSSLVVLFTLTANGVSAKFTNACQREDVNRARGIGTCRNRHDG